ncbi:MAG: 3-methyl-2-oxobutanoate hydroxymethyltransferase [Candidatus Heimdallarchaeota archaeon]|nr:3-methyl-2-oxobutanoate hydroxymethyltransferase [Candidatus Heimdallarchaeota archaeon]
MPKLTAFDIQKMKKAGKKISMLTAYDSSMASIFDEAQIDIILIGDSIGQVIYGAQNTLEVTLEMTLRHTQAVARGATNYSLIIADMPFLSFGLTIDETVANAGKLVSEGHAEAVKLEGASETRLAEIKAITDIGIPVQGHIGLLPQSANKLGGYKVQGRLESFYTEEELLESARKLEKAGCFSIILEAIPHEVAKKITEAINIPTIGIGAGPDCNGQVLVSYDMLGFKTIRKPKFVKFYADLHQIILEAAKKYSQEVKEGIFPTLEYSYEK